MGNQNFDSESSKTYIDFFAGCGGLSLGLGWAGWNGVFAVEKDPMAYESFDKNLVDVSAPHRHFYNWPIWLTREAHSIEDILELIKKDKKASQDKMIFIVPNDKKKVVEIKLTPGEIIEIL